jgi:hypothetical protein
MRFVLEFLPKRREADAGLSTLWILATCEGRLPLWRRCAEGQVPLHDCEVVQDAAGPQARASRDNDHITRSAGERCDGR